MRVVFNVVHINERARIVTGGHGIDGISYWLAYPGGSLYWGRNEGIYGYHAVDLFFLKLR